MPSADLLPPARYAAWGWVVLAVLPYWLPYISHFTRPDALPTGFLVYDMPYYVANGKAVFERGNGLAGPNPYDAATDAPVIYFHWLTWLLGFGVTQLGIDPGMWFVTVGAIGGLACSRLTYAVVQTVLPASRAIGPLFLAVMWCGGLLVAGRIGANIVAGRSLFDEILFLDPALGGWSLYWGRVVIYPTEAVYHALAMGAWLSVMRGRPLLAVGFAALLASTHPFSGAQLLAVLGAWWALRVWGGPRDKKWIIEGALLAVVGMAFLGYYVGFLERFAAHRAIRATWTIQWAPSVLCQVLAYGPVAALAAVRLWVDRRRADEQRIRGFLCAATSVSLALSNHHWVTTPHQPLHFTRGYVWLPLVLLGLPLVQRWVSGPRIVPRLAAAALAIVLTADNIVYVGVWCGRARHYAFYFTPGAWDTLVAVRDRQERGVLVSESRDLAYLVATYTAARPYAGHEYLTPDWDRRTAVVRDWFSHGGPAPWLASVDLVIVSTTTLADRGPALGLMAPMWEVLHPSDEYVLLGRRGR